jgi:hypothetical protein
MDFRNPILILLGSLVAHAHFKETSIGEAIVVAALCALYGYNLYLDSKKEKPINEDTKREIADLRDTVFTLKETVGHFKMTKVFGK